MDILKYIAEKDPEKGYWGEHPDYPLTAWRYEVLNNTTRQGYWEWCAAQEVEV